MTEPNRNFNIISKFLSNHNVSRRVSTLYYGAIDGWLTERARETERERKGNSGDELERSAIHHWHSGH